jgi:hypothetical protein
LTTSDENGTALSLDDNPAEFHTAGAFSSVQANNASTLKTANNFNFFINAHPSLKTNSTQQHLK